MKRDFGLYKAPGALSESVGSARHYARPNRGCVGTYGGSRRRRLDQAASTLAEREAERKARYGHAVGGYVKDRTAEAPMHF